MDKGIFAVYKPVGITSHDVVDKVRDITKVKRVGHGGTLDPMAEGVLVIAVGRENTKKLDKYVRGDKEYAAALNLGFTSDTDDREGPIHEYISDNPNGGKSNTKTVPTLSDIKDCIKKFTGEIMQTPPIYSAIKIQGKEAYKYARQARNQGLTLITHVEGLTLKPRPVFIKNIKVVSYEYPLLELKIQCGTGVYIRSLARDLGNELNTGAYLTKLVRTKVGEFRIRDALKLENLQNS